MFIQPTTVHTLTEEHTVNPLLHLPGNECLKLWTFRYGIAGDTSEQDSGCFFCVYASSEWKVCYTIHWSLHNDSVNEFIVSALKPNHREYFFDKMYSEEDMLDTTNRTCSPNSHYAQHASIKQTVERYRLLNAA